MYKFVCAHLPKSRCVTNKCKKIPEKNKFQISNAHSSSSAPSHDCCEDAEEINEGENSPESTHQLKGPDKLRHLVFPTNLLRIKGNKLIQNSKLREQNHTFYASLIVDPPVPSISKKYFHVYSISWLPKRFYTPCNRQMTKEEMQNYKNAMEQIESIQKQRTGLTKIKTLSAHKVNSVSDTWLKKKKRQTSKTEITYPTHTIKHNLTLNRRYRIREGSVESKLKFFEDEFVKRKQIQAQAMKYPRYKPIVYPKNNKEVKNKSLTKLSNRAGRSEMLDVLEEPITKPTEILGDNENSAGESSIKSHPIIENASNEIKMKLKTKFVQLLLKPAKKLNAKDNTENMESENNYNNISGQRTNRSEDIDEVEQSSNFQEEKIQSHPISLPAKEEASPFIYPKRIYVDTSNVYEIDKVCVVEKSDRNNQGATGYTFDQSDAKKDLPHLNVAGDYTLGKVNRSFEQLEKEIEKLSQIITRLQDLERKIELSSRKLDKQKDYEETISNKIDELSKQRDIIIQELKQIPNQDTNSDEQSKSRKTHIKENIKCSTEPSKVSKGKLTEPNMHVTKYKQDDNSLMKNKENVEKLSPQNEKVTHPNKTIKLLDESEKLTDPKNASKQFGNFNSKHSVVRRATANKKALKNHKKSIIELNLNASQHKRKKVLKKQSFEAPYKVPLNENDYKNRMEEENDCLKNKRKPFGKSGSDRNLKPDQKNELNPVKKSVQDSITIQTEPKRKEPSGGLDIIVPSKSESNILNHPIKMKQEFKTSKSIKESEYSDRTIKQESRPQSHSVIKRSTSFDEVPIDSANIVKKENLSQEKISYKDTFASSFAQMHVKKYWFQNQSINKKALNMEIEQNKSINALKKFLNTKTELGKSTLGNSGDNKLVTLNDSDNANYAKRNPFNFEFLNNEAQRLKNIPSGPSKTNDEMNQAKSNDQKILLLKPDNNITNQESLGDLKCTTANYNQNIFISMTNDAVTKKHSKTNLESTSVNKNQNIVEPKVDNINNKGKNLIDSKATKAHSTKGSTDQKQISGQSSGDQASQTTIPEIKCIMQYNPTNDQLTLNIPDAGKALPIKKSVIHEDKTKEKSSDSNAPVLKDITIKDINEAILKEYFTEKLLPGTLESIYLPKHQLVIYEREYKEDSNDDKSAEMDKSPKKHNLPNLSDQKNDTNKENAIENVCSVKSADLLIENNCNNPKEEKNMHLETKPLQTDIVPNPEVEHKSDLKMNGNLVKESVKNAVIEKRKDPDDEFDIVVSNKMQTINKAVVKEEVKSSEISKNDIVPLNVTIQTEKKERPKSAIQVGYSKKTKKTDFKGKKLNENLEIQKGDKSKTDATLENKTKNHPLQASSASLTFMHNKEHNPEKKECKTKIGSLKTDPKTPSLEEPKAANTNLQLQNTKPDPANNVTENKPEINVANKIRVSPQQGPPNGSLKYVYQTGNDLKQKEVIRPEMADLRNKEKDGVKGSIILTRIRETSSSEPQNLKENNSDINLGNKIRAPPPQAPPRSDKEKKDKPKGKKDIVLPPKIRNVDSQLPENISRSQNNKNVAKTVEKVEENIDARKIRENEVVVANKITKTNLEDYTRNQGIPKIVKINGMSPSGYVSKNALKAFPARQQKSDSRKMTNTNISEEKNKNNNILNNQKISIETSDIKNNSINQKIIMKQSTPLSTDQVEKLNIQSRCLLKQSLKGNQSSVKLNQKEDKEIKKTVSSNYKKENINRPFSAVTKKEFGERTSTEQKIVNINEDKIKIKERPISSQAAIKSGIQGRASSVNSRSTTKEKENQNNRFGENTHNEQKLNNMHEDKTKIKGIPISSQAAVKSGWATSLNSRNAAEDKVTKNNKNNLNEQKMDNIPEDKTKIKGRPISSQTASKSGVTGWTSSLTSRTDEKETKNNKHQEPTRDTKNSVKAGDKYQDSPRIIKVDLPTLKDSFDEKTPSCNAKESEKIDSENKQTSENGSESVLTPKKKETNPVKKEAKKVSTAEKTGRPTSCPPMKPQAANYCSGATKRSDYVNSKKKNEEKNNKMTKRQRTSDGLRSKEENPTVVTFVLPNLEDRQNEDMTNIDKSKNEKSIEKQANGKKMFAASKCEAKDIKEKNNSKEFPNQSPQHTKSIVKITLPKLDLYSDETKPDVKTKADGVSKPPVHETHLLSQKKLLEDQKDKLIPTVKMSTISYEKLYDKDIRRRGSFTLEQKKLRTYTTTNNLMNRSNPSAIFKILPESEIMILKKAEYSSTKKDGENSKIPSKEEENHKERKVKESNEESKIAVEMSTGNKQELVETPQKSQPEKVVENIEDSKNSKQEIGELLMQEVQKLFNGTSSNDNKGQSKKSSLKNATKNKRQQNTNEKQTGIETKFMSEEETKLEKNKIPLEKRPVLAQISANNIKSYEGLKKEAIVTQKLPPKIKLDVAGEIGKQLIKKTKSLHGSETKKDIINERKIDKPQTVKNKIIDNDSEVRLRSDTLTDNIKKVEDVLKKSGFLQTGVKKKEKTQMTRAGNDTGGNENMNVLDVQNNTVNENRRKNDDEIKKLYKEELKNMKIRSQKEANIGKLKINSKANQIEKLNSAAKHILKQEEEKRLDEMLKGNRRQTIYQKDAKVISPSVGKAILEQNIEKQESINKESLKQYDKEQLMSRAEYLQWRKTLKSKDLKSTSYIESKNSWAVLDTGNNYLNAKETASLIIENIKHKKEKTLILNNYEVINKNIKREKLETKPKYNSDLNRQKNKDQQNSMKNLSEHDVNEKIKNVTIKDQQIPNVRDAPQPEVKYSIDLKCPKRKSYNLTENDQSEKQRSTHFTKTKEVLHKTSFSKLILPLKKLSDEMKKDSDINDCGNMLEKSVSNEIKAVSKANRWSKRKRSRNPLTKYAHLRISYITMKRPRNNSDNFLPTTKKKQTETREISEERKKEIVKMRYEILRRLNEKFEKENSNVNQINKNILTPEVVPYKFDNDDVKFNKSSNIEYRTKPGRIRKIAMKPRIKIGFQYSVYSRNKEVKSTKDKGPSGTSTVRPKNNKGGSNDIGNRRKYSTMVDTDNKECEDVCKVADSNNRDQTDANQDTNGYNDKSQGDDIECIAIEKDFDITEVVPQAFECASEELEENRQNDLYYRYHQLSFYDLHTYLRNWRTSVADIKEENQSTKNDCNFDEVD
ncbi:hypothetical protein GWI33_019389 [Rhynchophorus ferrugineus]|uniref:Uncharacterized protein n=1 Tax=Rhynchophorus ferrugineus TaxID=354439 RepID=A0A834HUU4_RHYFE|nr:hypothetical protein GWI33_019389 [Rhynchophorus ferrugineus]